MSSGAAPVEDPTGTSSTSLAASPPLFSIERVVTLLTPFFASAATWVAGLIASNVPFAPHPTSTQIEGVMISAFLGTVAVVIKWLHGRQIPAVAKLSPIKVSQHTLDTMYSEIETYLRENADVFRGPKGEPGTVAQIAEADLAPVVEQLVTRYVGGISAESVQAFVRQEVSAALGRAAGTPQTT